jgi:hypothetical protein
MCFPKLINTMDPIVLFAIIIITAAIIVIDFDKRQKDRVTTNLHTDNLKQLLTITALEYCFSISDNKNENDSQVITTQITQLVNSYEQGDMETNIFEEQMDYLLSKLN